MKTFQKKKKIKPLFSPDKFVKNLKNIIFNIFKSHNHDLIQYQKICVSVQKPINLNHQNRLPCKDVSLRKGSYVCTYCCICLCKTRICVLEVKAAVHRSLAPDPKMCT